MDATSFTFAANMVCERSAMHVGMPVVLCSLFGSGEIPTCEMD